MKIMNKTKLKKIVLSKNKHAYSAVETEIAVLKKLVNIFLTNLYRIIHIL